MAQEGDTITYTYSDGTSVGEDVSNVEEVVVEYCDAGGGGDGVGFSAGAPGGFGGRAENVTIDVSNASTLYIWVSGAGGSSSGGQGRYDGGDGSGPSYPAGGGGASSEISFSPNFFVSDEPFLVGAGGGGGGGADFGGGGGGARGGTGNQDGGGLAPPAGADGGADDTEPGGDGDGAIESKSEVTGGTTIKGGGSAPTNDGEVKLSFRAKLSPPDPPSNLTAEMQ